jgi:hypothetical protein
MHICAFNCEFLREFMFYLMTKETSEERNFEKMTSHVFKKLMLTHEYE